MKRHEIFSVNLYLISYQQLLLHQIILINKHFKNMLLCSEISNHKGHNITDLSQLRKGGKSYAVSRLGNDFSHSENYRQKIPLIPSSPFHKIKTCDLNSTARRSQGLQVTMKNLIAN